MKITEFFGRVLGVELNNSRWSWGAINPASNRVYLRVWQDQIENDTVGQKVQVYWNKRVTSSPGYDERLRQIEAIREGAQGVGIICEAAKSRNERTRRIKRFNPYRLLLLGVLTENKRGMFAHINRYIPIDELTSNNTMSNQLTQDINEIRCKKRLKTTTKLALIDARIGQGAFRKQVLELWDKKCAVTGSSIQDVIRASHIIPWRDSTNSERLDARNGLSLVAGLDALFDAGLISFDNSGRILVSSQLPLNERELHGVIDRRLVKIPHKKTLSYLKRHRNRYFYK